MSAVQDLVSQSIRRATALTFESCAGHARRTGAWYVELMHPDAEAIRDALELFAQDCEAHAKLYAEPEVSE